MWNIREGWILNIKKRKMEKVYIHICLSRGWLRSWKYFKYFAVDEAR